MAQGQDGLLSAVCRIPSRISRWAEALRDNWDRYWRVCFRIPDRTSRSPVLQTGRLGIA